MTPYRLTFHRTGKSAARDVSVMQSGYDGAFTEHDTCAGIVAVAALSNADGNATFAVAPVAVGSCKATFAGGNSQSATLAVSVSVPGTITIVPASLTFTSLCASCGKSVSVTQSGFSGSFSETDDCSGTAGVVPGTNTGGSATYAVSPLKAGACTAVFKGGGRKTGALPIVVSLPGGVVASPSPLNFEGIGASNAVVEVVTQAKYTGTFTESDDCSGIVTFQVTANAKGTGKYLATPVATGVCAAIFTGGSNQSFTLNTTVTLTGFGIQEVRT
ncbi:MAG: hypothetical protein JO199_13735 [Candidatus Eremiobacteraeota bacterium]|nr:hypothetical protein [Candidatus Eremiobacteraeota bacterium]